MSSVMRCRRGVIMGNSFAKLECAASSSFMLSLQRHQWKGYINLLACRDVWEQSCYRIPRSGLVQCFLCRHRHKKHTVRGFASILGSRGGEKIESSKNAAGERTYKIPK